MTKSAHNTRAIATGAFMAAAVVGLTAFAPGKPTRKEAEWGVPTADYIERTGYLYSFDGRLRSARWTLHYLSPNVIANCKEDRCDFRVDQSIPEEFRPSLKDYEGTALHDRGHLVPAEDASWSPVAA